MIDCDVHVQIAHPEELLRYIDEAERDWYRNQAYLLGLPSYPWSNPSTWYRGDLETDETGTPGGNARVVAKEVLDDQGADLAILTADDALSVGLMENAYRDRKSTRLNSSH